jgi:hypothetical protein
MTFRQREFSSHEIPPGDPEVDSKLPVAQADDEGMLAYYRSIGGATRQGMLIYSRDWASLSPAMVERLG